MRKGTIPNGRYLEIIIIIIIHYHSARFKVCEFFLGSASAIANICKVGLVVHRTGASSKISPQSRGFGWRLLVMNPAIPMMMNTAAIEP
mmetsp:Transcript_94279/g.166377  ORF Transcript_94279/g.166377 Transcript_94279/m.166377 type:complete len:89 (+) Transcript_94279:35-301(+)